MNNVINLNKYRNKALHRKCFSVWEKRFKETFALTARLKDISDETLYRLAEPGIESNLAFYDLIMGALELGPSTKFGFLGSEEKMTVVDIHLFLADQVRFELMRRLGWLRQYATENEHLVTMVQEMETLKAGCKNNVPELSPEHPEYEKYCTLLPRDREALIRGLLVAALEAFKARIK